MTDSNKPNQLATTPPPPGEDDAYSASTVVGQASAELLALVRAAEEGALEGKSGAPGASGKPSPTEEDNLAAMKESASRSAKEAAANELAKKQASAAPPPEVPRPAPPRVSRPAPPAASASAKPPPAPPADTAPALAAQPATPAAAVAVSAAPAPAVAPTSAPVRVARAPGPNDTAKRPAIREEERRPSSSLPPFVTILAVFIAATIALAALVR